MPIAENTQARRFKASRGFPAHRQARSKCAPVKIFPGLETAGDPVARAPVCVALDCRRSTQGHAHSVGRTKRDAMPEAFAVGDTARHRIGSHALQDWTRPEAAACSIQPARNGTSTTHSTP